MDEGDRFLVELFYQELVRQGLGLRTCQRHRDNLYFFLEAYLEASEGMRLGEVDAETLDYFLSRWYPNKVIGSRSELNGFITSFRRFFRFLHELGEVPVKCYEEIFGVLSRRDYYLLNFSKNSGNDLGGEKTGVDGVGSSSVGDMEYGADFFMDRGLYLLVRNLEKQAVNLVSDFELFMDYLVHHRVQLRFGSGGLPRRELHRLNQMFSSPERFNRSSGQEQSQRISIFYQLGRSLDLFVVGGYSELLVSPRSEFFLELDFDQKMVILLDGFWNRMRWSELERFGGNGFSSWAQEQRGGFAELLSRLPVGERVEISHYTGSEQNLRMLSNYLKVYEVVESKIMFGLKEFGILDYEFQSGRDSYSKRNHRGIESIAISKFGKKIMKYFARRAREEMELGSLIEFMDEALHFI